MGRNLRGARFATRRGTHVRRIVGDEAGANLARARGGSAPGLVARSFGMIVGRPRIAALLIGSALAQFFIETAGGSPVNASDLGTMFAPPPVDSFTWLKLFQGDISPMQAVPILILRLLAIWLFLSMILRRPASVGGLVRVAAVYAAALGVFGGFVILGTTAGPVLVKVLAGALAPGAGGGAILAGRLFSFGLVYFGVLAPALVWVTVAISPFFAGAVRPGVIQPASRNRSVWLMIALSTALYLTVSISGQTGWIRPAAFFGAFLILLVQAAIFGGVVLAAGDH